MNRFCHKCTFALLLVCFSSMNCLAQTWEGDNGTNGLLGFGRYWSDAANWNPSLPANTGATTFGTLPGLGSSSVLIGGTEFANSMTFNAAVNYDFSGDTINNPSATNITLGNTGANSNPFITNSSTGNQSINVPINFLSTATGTRTITNSSSGSITFGASNAVNSIVTNTTGTLAIVNGTGTTTFQGAVNTPNGMTVNSAAGGVVSFNSSVTANSITTSGGGIIRLGNGGETFSGNVIAGGTSRLEGIGTVNGLTTVSSGASYSAGQTGIANGVGTQNLAGGLNFSNNLSGNANFVWDLNKGVGFDQVVVGTGLTIGEGFRTQINLSGASVVVGDAWNVFTGTTITGTNATNLLNGTFVTSGAPSGISFQWSVVGGNIGRITAVPEPSSMALLGMAGLIGGVYARRRAKKNKA